MLVVALIICFAVFQACPAIRNAGDEDLHIRDERSSPQLKFEGCYSDTEDNVLQGSNVKHFTASDNHNIYCTNKCQEEGFAISSTKGSDCYCSNVLPLPRLYSNLEEEASGTDGPCSTTCPGAYTSQGCEGEECCGGPSAYSVYIVGDIDALKQLTRRIASNLEDICFLSEVMNTISGPTSKLSRSYSSTHTFPTTVIVKSVTFQLYYGNNNNANFQLKDVNGVILADKNGVKSVKKRSAPYSIEYEPYYYSKTYNPPLCVKSVVVSSPSSFNLGVNYVAYSSISALDISAYGNSVNSEGNQGPKECTLTVNPSSSSQESYSCTAVATAPDNQVELEMRSMEKLLESTEPIKEEPESSFDIMIDNQFGNTDLVLSKSYEVTVSFGESWSTEHGVDITVTIGAEFEAGALFAKATTSFELAVGYSFSSGYEKSISKEVTEAFEVEGTAEPGTKLEVRLFKSQMPVEVKWRAELFALGHVTISTGGKSVDKPLVELLSDEQRKLFAFGSIDYGERKTVIARSNTIT